MFLFFLPYFPSKTKKTRSSSFFSAKELAMCECSLLSLPLPYYAKAPWRKSTDVSYLFTYLHQYNIVHFAFKKERIAGQNKTKSAF